MYLIYCLRSREMMAIQPRDVYGIIVLRRLRGYRPLSITDMLLVKCLFRDVSIKHAKKETILEGVLRTHVC